MTELTTTGSGVQELIDRIRDQGIQAATAESNRLLQQARQQADDIVTRAHAEAEAAQQKSRTEIEAFRQSSLEAIKLAARDTVLDLKARVTARFEEFVKRLVVAATQDKELVRSIVLVLAGHAAEEFIEDKEIEVRLSNALLDGHAGPVFKDAGKLAILGLSSDMLREGIELIGDGEIAGGARVRLVHDKLEIDLSDRAIARMIAQRIMPRFRAILEGNE